MPKTKRPVFPAYAVECAQRWHDARMRWVRTTLPAPGSPYFMAVVNERQALEREMECEKGHFAYIAASYKTIDAQLSAATSHDVAEKVA